MLVMPKADAVSLYVVFYAVLSTELRGWETDRRFFNDSSVRLSVSAPMMFVKVKRVRMFCSFRMNVCTNKAMACDGAQ